MGTYNKGINGSFKGKIGNTVGSNWKGVKYMKSMPDKPTKWSKKQIMQRAKFQFASNFIQPLQSIIKIGFRMQEHNKSARNAAMSELLNYAIEGDYPSYNVIYPRLQLAKGSLHIPEEYSVELIERKAVFTWEPGDGCEDETDSYNSFLNANNAILVTLADGYQPKYSLRKFKRGDGTGSVGIPVAPAGTEVHCYLAFAATDDNLQVSNSLYVGSVVVPE